MTWNLNSRNYILAVAIAIVVAGSASLLAGSVSPSSLQGNNLWRRNGNHIFNTNPANVGIGIVSPTQKLAVSGIIQSSSGGMMFPDGTLQITAAQPTAIPSGVIVMWSGSTGSVPIGWALCNGQSGTPNLQDRFIVGAGSSYTVGQTGGSTTHEHLINSTSGVLIDDNSGGSDYLLEVRNHLPPFYALAYIMKL